MLTRDNKGRFINLGHTKERFLTTLDRRHFVHFSPEEREALGTKIVTLFMGDMRILPAIRFSSLCFWYAYIDVDRAYPMKREGSDIVDFDQMSLIPYCSVFTADTTMYRLVPRVMAEVNYACKVLNHRDLDAMLFKS